MKIALLSEKYTPDIGGPAISAGRLGQLLSFAGHEVRVFSPSLDQPAFETRTLTYRGISVTRFGAHKRVDDTPVITNPSNLAKKAKALVNREVALIPNEIDTELFKPMERNEGLADTLGLNTLLQSDTIPVIGFAGELR